MAHEAAPRSASYGLPLSVVEPSDIRRLLRELEDVDDFLRQASLRKPGTNVVAPKTTKNLESFMEVNQLNLLEAVDRSKTSKLLQQILDDAPVMHISFASEPSVVFMTKIMTWLRQNIHPFVLVQIGLQPSIAAGCVVRTENKVFDFSMRQFLIQKRNLLTKAISKMEVKTPVAARPLAPAAVPLRAAAARPAHAVHARAVVASAPRPSAIAPKPEAK